MKMFWSGGFDSTFMLLDELHRNGKVELCTARGLNHVNGELNERRARMAILRALKRPDLIVHPYYVGHVNREFKAARDESNKLGFKLHVDLGWQTWYHVAFARKYGEISVGMTKNDGQIRNDEVRKWLEANGVKLPLKNLTKGQMWNIANEKGYVNVLLMSWSCTQRIESQKPCGRCPSCTRRKNEE